MENGGPKFKTSVFIISRADARSERKGHHRSSRYYTSYYLWNIAFQSVFSFSNSKSQEIPEFDFGTSNYVVHYFRRRVHHFRPPCTPSSLAGSSPLLFLKESFSFLEKHALNVQCKDQEKALVTYLMKQKCQIALVKLWEYTFVFSDVFLLLDSAILEAS